MKKILKNCIWILPAGVVLGVVLLLFSFLIPASCFQGRLAGAAAVLAQEDVYPLEDYSRRQMDNYTDSIMLLEADYDGPESLWAKAINVYRVGQKGHGPYKAVVDQTRLGDADAYRASYARYWHGFLVFLRPAYAMLGYLGIRHLNMLLQYALLTLLLLLLRWRCPQALLPFILTVLLLAPTAITRSLQFSSVYYVVLFTSLLLLWDPGELLAGDRAAYLFLLAGMATVYLDLLTYPTASLTIPLTLLCAREARGACPPRESLRRVLLCAALWFLGYGCMWAGKWLLAALLGGGDFLESLLNVIRTRSSATNGYNDHVSRTRALWVNVKMLFENRHLLLLTGFYAGAALLLRLRGLARRGAGADRRLLLFLIPAAIGPCWLLLLSNHSTIHCWFTYRTLAATVFSLLTALGLAAEARGEEEKNG
ncbi:MAG: hypothetical protein IJ594_09930 [Oscillospiraceae bacterium]|nr:hypothetical protein [Oscillospiraceae bacterium]